MQHEDAFPKKKRHAYRERSEMSESAEMEVVKAILLREEYIERIKANLSSQGLKFGKDRDGFDGLLGLVDLLRLTTVDTCEAIRQWRRSQGSPSMPFVWKGMNYLLKIPIDLNILDDHKLLRTWLSFSLRRNPFLCPVPLEKLAGVSNAPTTSRQRVFSLDTKGFFSVGGSTTFKPRTKDTVGGDLRAPSSLHVGGSAIADGDMGRIGEAAAMILHEEETHGRYTVDNSSRLVPVGSAEKLKFSRQLKLDDNRGVHMPAIVSQDLAPFTDMAGIGRVSEEVFPGDLGELSSTGGRRDVASSVVGLSSSGKASAKRAGGRLRLVTVHSTPPRKRAPVIRRSVGAMLRAEMLQRQQQNTLLQNELESLRQHLSKVYSTSTELPPTESLCLKFPEDGETKLPRDDASGCVGPDRLTAIGEAALKIDRKADELGRRIHRQAALEEQLRIFQAKERDRETKKRAKVLERKRRLLEHDPDLLQPQVDDEYTLEEEAATRIQRIARGVQGRTRVGKLRPVLNNAATAIQAIIRGHLGRSRVELKIVDKRSVTNIQRVWRGHRGRCATISDRRKLERTTAARNIQKIARGRCGRRRVDHKRGLRESAKNGAEVVGVKQLFHQDVVELADAVDAVLVGHSSAAPLPGVVLGLAKVVALMLEEDEESAAVTRYSALGVKSVEMVQPALQFTWHDALSLFRRSHKLLRRLRQVAEGPASRRSRIVYFSRAAVRAYAALRRDQGWNVANIGRVGRGAKACQHLMMWVDALQEVFAYQREFSDDLGSDRMPWVARVQQTRRCMRHLKLSHMVWEHAVTCLQQILHESRESAPKQSKHLLVSDDCKSRRGDLRLCVAENALQMLRAHETCAKDALCRMKREEEEAQKSDEAREQLREETLVEDLNHAEANLAKGLKRLEEAKRAARDGIETDQVHLQLFLDELATCEVVRRERWTSLEMFRTQRRRNDKRRGVDVEVWGNLRHQLRVVGELEAASFLAAEDLKFVRDGPDSDGSTAPAGSRRHELELLQAKANEAQSSAVAAQRRLTSMEEEQENANTVASEAELHKEETVLPHEWDDASEEEREEDLREDEQCARWEAHAATQFVPSAMIARPFQRPRPMVICISRDVPGTAKRKIVRHLESDLPGLTIHIDDERNMGLQIGDLQQALSIRYSVVCHVDIGIGETRRKAFMQRLATVREALIPTPNFILVVGDSKNRSGGPLDSSVGCTGRDLYVMGDGEIKKRLEDVARIAKEIHDPVFLEAMANMGQQVTPPSQSHVLVMEALIILLMPRTVFHNHIPLSSLRGVTWTEARHILGHPDKLWAAIARVDACNIPPVNLSTLKVYIGHEGWPRSGGECIGDGGVLEILAAWARSTIEISVLLARAGGSPEGLCHYSKAHVGLLAAVVPVHDEYLATEWDSKIKFKRGWRSAYNQTLAAVLEDVRVFRAAKRIRGSQAEGVHLVEIYQECGRLFFHTYDPDSCVSSFCVVEETKISHLLAPTLDQPPEFGPSTIPCHRQDMFERLVALLSFEAARSNDTVGVWHLTCQRRLRRIMHDTRQISGHAAQITVYEEAKGELRYSLYLAEHAARIQLKVDASLLAKVLQDTSSKTGERQAVTSEDTSRLLVPITDRLGISPSRTAVSTMGASRGFHERKTSSQGFTLKIRYKGGPGRRVLRAVCLISGTSHVLSAWELGRGGLLRLAAYDPKTSMTYEASLSKAERACFGYEGEDRRSWIKQLRQRLSLRRAQKPSSAENRTRRTLTCDKTVFSTACRLAAGRIDTHLFRMRATLVDAGGSLALDLYQADTSKWCRILLNSDDLEAAGLEAGTAIAGVEQGDGSEPDCKTASMLVGPRRRETAIRQLTRHLRFVRESDSVTFSVNRDSSTTSVLVTSTAVHRRPQSSLKSAFLQPAGISGSYSIGHYGLEEGFLKRRRQPCVLRHGHERAHSQNNSGKKRVAATAASREASKRNKGKQKRVKKHIKSADEGGRLTTVPSELSGGKVQENIEKRTEATQLLQDEPIESKLDPIRSEHSGTAPMSLPRDGERKVFQGAISIRRGDWEVHQPVCDTVVTVFESFRPRAQDIPDNDDMALRAVVYYSKLAAYAEVWIKSFQDLRQVVGALHQSLAHEWRRQPKDDGATEALFKFIFHNRAMIVVGTWDGDQDRYCENGTDFTILLKRSRLYRSFKQTPVHLSGVKDAQVNAHKLIDDSSRRGKKVFRRAVNVSSTLFQITAYELPTSEASQDAAPTLRFIAYDPKTQVQLVAVVQPDAVLELGGGSHSPWMAQDKREVLSEILAQAFRLKTGHDGSPTLFLPWSGENLAFVDEVQAGETYRPRRDKVLVCAKREGLSRLEVFSTRVTDYEVVITVFAETNALSPVPAPVAQDNDTEDGDGPTLAFNLYCPKLSQSVDIDLPHALQKMMTGRSILQFPKGEARSSAIRRSARFLCITSPSPSEGLQAEFLFASQKPWLVAYNELDASDRPSTRRPRGMPLIFVPGDTDGDLIASKGISINGFVVLLSVHTKERGRPGREGLVLEVYNAETSVSSILHLSASHLLKQVDEKDHLLEDGRLLMTIDMLTKRLRLKKCATGAWELRMDRSLSPYLFMGM